MKRLPEILKDLATPRKCNHFWIKDKQGKYCDKCGKRIYNFIKTK